MKVLSFFTKLLHFFPEEFSHSLALRSLKFLYLTGFLRLLVKKQKYNENLNKHLRKQGFLSNFKNGSDSFGWRSWIKAWKLN